MIPSAPTFKKIDLILKVNQKDNKEGVLFDIPSTVKISHDDCAMVITGDYVIITEEEGNNEIDTINSIKGKIYELKEIDSYRLYKD